MSDRDPRFSNPRHLDGVSSLEFATIITLARRNDIFEKEQRLQQALSSRSTNTRPSFVVEALSFCGFLTAVWFAVGLVLGMEIHFVIAVSTAVFLGSTTTVQRFARDIKEGRER